MLTECPDNEAALFPASCILQQSVHETLLGICAALALDIGNFNQATVYTLDRERLGLSQGEALLLLRLECHVSRISVLVIDSLEGSVVQSTDLLQCFGNRRPSQPQLH